MRRLLLAALCLAGIPAFGRDVIRVAAAANLTYVLGPVDAAFEKLHPDAHVEPVFGASGSLYAQILHGAPFDLLLSADTEFPRKLVAANAAGDEPRVFVRGRLVLWTLSEAIILDDVGAAVRSDRVHRIAIAQPKTAPYGAAAMSALTRLGLLPDAQPKIVTGESIAQTFQYVQTGNADIGFVALSLLLGSDQAKKGHWVEIPDTLYPPLDQGAVLTRAGKAHPLAVRYADFLLGPEARALFQQNGYALP